VDVVGVAGGWVTNEGVGGPEKVCEPVIPTRIRQIERIVHHIRIAVVALQHAGRLDEGVGAHEAAYQGVVDAPVHVYDAGFVQVLVFGKAAVGGAPYQAVGGVGQAVGVAAFAPGVVGQALYHVAGDAVGNGGDGAQVVVVKVAQAGCPAYNKSMNLRVYVETSVISYLTARPSRDLIMAAHQEVTREWWQNRRHAFALFYSEAVRNESALGDPQAAAQRLALLDDLNLLEIPLQAMGLANALVDATALPAKARVDALHIAIAAYERMDFVLTWNFKHIANAQSASKVRQVCESFGLTCPVLCSPLELLEVN
jgi:hypothetical protein